MRETLLPKEAGPLVKLRGGTKEGSIKAGREARMSTIRDTSTGSTEACAVIGGVSRSRETIAIGSDVPVLSA